MPTKPSIELSTFVSSGACARAGVALENATTDKSAATAAAVPRLRPGTIPEIMIFILETLHTSVKSRVPPRLAERVILSVFRAFWRQIRGKKRLAKKGYCPMARPGSRVFFAGLQES